MAGWDTIVLPALVAVAIVAVPGLVVAAALGLRGAALLGTAGPVSIAVVGTTGVVAAVVGVPFSVLPVAVTTVLAALVAGVVGWAIRRREPALVSSSFETPSPLTHLRPTLVLAAAALLAAGVIGTIAYGAVASPALPSQTYDGVFHLNAVAWILDRGDASSFHLYRMANPSEGIEFYPAAWHALAALVVQLTGASIPTAAAAAWIATSGFVFASGSAWLALVVVPSARRPLLVGIAGAVGATVTAAAPYVLLRWGVLYPTGVAYALLPAGLALSVLVLRSGALRKAWPPALLLLVWFVAEAFAHPRSLISYALLVVPLLVGGVIGWARRGLASEHRRRTLIQVIALAIGVVVAAALAAVAVLAYFRADVRPISDRLNGGPATAHQTLGESLLQALLLAPPSGPSESTTAVGVVVTVAVLAGLVLAFREPRARWVAAAFLLVAVFYAASAGSNSDLAKVMTGFWYKDKFRLFALLGVLAPALLAVFVAAVDRSAAELGRRPLTRLRPLIAPALVVVVALGGWLGPSLTAMRDVIASDYAVAAQKDGRLLDADEFALLSELDDLTPAGSVIVGNPWNGSSLSWALGGRESLFPHLTGRWDPDRLTVADRLDRATTDPSVCEALDRLGVRYLLVSSGLLWGGDPAASLYPGIDRAATAPGFEPIATEGGSTLYRIVACGS